MREQLERWKVLCEMAANEQNPKKLIELKTEINQLPEARERRLKSKPPATGFAE